MQQHREPRRALDQRADRRAPEPEDEVTFPVPGHGTVLRLGGTLTDEHLLGDEVLPAPRPTARDPQRTTGAQARRQLTAQRAATLDIERLIDRLVRDTHRLIIRELQTQPVRDLLRAPRLRPAAVLAPAVTPPDPRHVRTDHQTAVRAAHSAVQSVLHIGSQHRVDDQLHRLRASGPPVRVPLRGARAIDQTATSCPGVATQLARDRRRRPAELPRDRPHPFTPSAQQRDLLPLGERQINGPTAGPW